MNNNTMDESPDSLWGNRFDHTFGILFNDIIVFDEYMLISLDVNHEYQLLRAHNFYIFVCV